MPSGEALKESAWQSALDTYKRENARVHRLMSGFDLGMPYRLVSAAELTTLLEASPGDRRSVYSGFPGGKLFSFSSVRFDPAKTRAILMFQYSCGFSCGASTNFVMEKELGAWRLTKAAISTCMTVA
jgi:hypothetical protein